MLGVEDMVATGLRLLQHLEQFQLDHYMSLSVVKDLQVTELPVVTTVVELLVVVTAMKALAEGQQTLEVASC